MGLIYHRPSGENFSSAGLRRLEAGFQDIQHNMHRIILPWAKIRQQLKRALIIIFVVAGTTYLLGGPSDEGYHYRPNHSPAFVVGQRGNGLQLHKAFTCDTDEDIESIAGRGKRKWIEFEDIKFFNAFNEGKVKSHNSTLNGVLNVHIWDEICTEEVSLLRHYPLFPIMPSRRMLIETFKVRNIGRNCGARIFGYIRPIKSGNHRFSIDVSYGEVELWLSSNAQPQNAKLICSTYSNGSVAVSLKKGHSYYVEALYKVGVRTSNFEVKWSQQDNIDKFLTIDSIVLRPYFDDKGIRGNDVLLNYKVPPNLNVHKKLLFPLDEHNQVVNKKRQMIHLPFIHEEAVKDLLPSCQYNPSYTIKSKTDFHEFQGVWETHYTAVHPADAPNITLKFDDNVELVQFGNDVLDQKKAQYVVDQVMTALEKLHPR